MSPLRGGSRWLRGADRRQVRCHSLYRRDYFTLVSFLQSSWSLDSGNLELEVDERLHVDVAQLERQLNGR